MKTLADVLYADQSEPGVVEEEWVALVRAIAGGDQLALHALYERSHRPVFTLLMRITRQREVAEELTVDLFHDVWRRAARYDAANGSVLGWIMNQARSRAIDRLRHDQRKKRVDPHPHGSAVAEAAVGSDEALQIEQRHSTLRSALAVLTPDEKQAIEAAFFGELTHAEVAEQLKQPLGTIKTRIRSGLQKLRRALVVEANEP